MSLQREILSPVTTAGLLYPALSQMVVQIANFEPDSTQKQSAQHGGKRMTAGKEDTLASTVILPNNFSSNSV